MELEVDEAAADPEGVGDELDGAELGVVELLGLEDVETLSVADVELDGALEGLEVGVSSELDVLVLLGLDEGVGVGVGVTSVSELDVELAALDGVGVGVGVESDSELDVELAALDGVGVGVSLQDDDDAAADVLLESVGEGVGVAERVGV